MTKLDGAQLLDVARQAAEREAARWRPDDRDDLAADVVLVLVGANPPTIDHARQLAERAAHAYRMRAARRRDVLTTTGTVPEPAPVDPDVAERERIGQDVAFALVSLCKAAYMTRVVLQSIRADGSVGCPRAL